MATVPQPRLSVEEYLAMERRSEQKHEFFAGEVFTFVGTTEPHSLIVTNLIAELSTQLKDRPCKVYPSDMRVKVSATALYTYPDVIVVSHGAEFDDDHHDTLLNPTVLFEVLSDSTEACDRGKKFEHYRTIESLADYVLVAQDHARIDHFRRQPDDHWLLSEVSDEGVLLLESIHCKLPLSEVYHQVDFP